MAASVAGPERPVDHPITGAVTCHMRSGTAASAEYLPVTGPSLVQAVLSAHRREPGVRGEEGQLVGGQARRSG